MKTETATFGSGCFWCTEAFFQRIDGVQSVTSGYMGGSVKDPTYKQVCGGQTGHAEVCQIVFDPAQVSYDELLEVFWNSHDPTTLNRQGNDVGTQYRSAIFTHSPEQIRSAQASRRAQTTSHAFRKPIVTEIVPAETFYKAEGYHQDYLQTNPNQPYCRFIASKIDKYDRKHGKKGAPDKPAP